MADAIKPAPSASSIALPVLPDGWEACRYSVLRNGELAILAADKPVYPRLANYDGEGPVNHPPQATGGVWTFDGHNLKEGPFFPLYDPLFDADRFPNGNWLLESHVYGRILSPSGEDQQSILLGHSISDFQIDDRNGIWVGWFDEGMFGNIGWEIPGHDWPPSGYGLVCFSDRGEILEHIGPSRRGHIGDCIGPNVIGDTVWSYTYPNFEILKMERDKPERWWKSPLSLCTALMVRPPFVLAVGGFGGDADLATLLRLEETEAKVLCEWRLPLRLMVPTDVDCFAVRADALHVVHKGIWRTWRLDDFLDG